MPTPINGIGLASVGGGGEVRARGPNLRKVPFDVFFLGVLVVIAAEIAAFVAVAEQIGFLWAFGILIVVSAIGPFIVRRVGFGIVVHTQERLARGELPTKELFDGLVVLFAGVLICVPGFVGDALGLLLMIGPVRHLLIWASKHQLARRVQKIQTRRWRIIDTHFQPMGDDFLRRPEPPDRSLGPGK